MSPHNNHPAQCRPTTMMPGHHSGTSHDNVAQRPPPDQGSPDDNGAQATTAATQPTMTFHDHHPIKGRPTTLMPRRPQRQLTRQCLPTTTTRPSVATRHCSPLTARGENEFGAAPGADHGVRRRQAAGRSGRPGTSNHNSCMPPAAATNSASDPSQAKGSSRRQPAMPGRSMPCCSRRCPTHESRSRRPASPPHKELRPGRQPPA